MKLPFVGELADREGLNGTDDVLMLLMIPGEIGMFGMLFGTKWVGEATRGGSGVVAEVGAEADRLDDGAVGGTEGVVVVAGAEARGGEGSRVDDSRTIDIGRFVRLPSVLEGVEGRGAAAESDVVRWRREDVDDLECFDEDVPDEIDDERCDFEDVLPLLRTLEDDE